MSYDAVKSLLNTGVSRPALYRVEVAFPFGAAESNRQLDLLCSKASVPPVSVNTLAVNGHESMGVTREQPTMVSFNSPFSITVISDREYTVYKDLKLWLDRVAVNANPNTLFAGSAGSNQRIGYYDSFRRTIQLNKLELQGGRGSREPNSFYEPFNVVFNGAFPVRLGEISLSSNSSNAYMEYTVDFAYENYTFNGGFGSVGAAVRSVAGIVGGLL